MEVSLGDRVYTYPSQELDTLADHTSLYTNKEWNRLRQELEKLGYVRIRGLHHREVVLKARTAVLEYIAQAGDGKLDGDHPLESGVLDSRCGRGCIPFMEGRNSITHSKEVKDVLEGDRPMEFFRNLFGAEPVTFDFKWLRGVHKNAFTGAHVDNVYMGRGTSDLLTMWTPMGDVTVDMGTLAVVEGSNNDKKFQKLQDTYGSCDLEAEGVSGTGWFTEDPAELEQRFNCSWKTANFSAGDVLIFTTRTIHMSTKNITNRVRISCDTRWQRRDQPADTRFIGESFSWLNAAPKHGLWAEGKDAESSTMEEMKEKWGFQ